ncbi:hypothetical protein C8J57DRAFT_1339241 [Mycena rebaudengoi]|nr:hypothetical protein C8J57DRAFT_1355394 [Mycena rebaudengoi]KAJ7259824.1 hypothetical protein C8J57DRAFT_1339241 [Mycena rebaudengoi]
MDDVLQCGFSFHTPNYNSLLTLAIQTHPMLAIPEFMRILIDEEDQPWDTAWQIITNTYTNIVAVRLWPQTSYWLGGWRARGCTMGDAAHRG